MYICMFDNDCNWLKEGRKEEEREKWREWRKRKIIGDEMKRKETDGEPGEKQEDTGERQGRK